MIATYCNIKSKKINKDYKKKMVSKRTSEISTFGIFHIARVIGYMLLGDKWGSKERDNLSKIIKLIEKDPEFLSKYYDQAFDVIDKIRAISKEKSSASNYYKAVYSQEAIEEHLYKPKPDK